MPPPPPTLGRLLGVDAIIMGSITQFGSADKKLGMGGGGFHLGGIGLGGLGTQNLQGNGSDRRADRGHRDRGGSGGGAGERRIEALLG